ncbi:MAG: hypothetical protein K2K66_04505 [Ruminococcus sp.]|nr:hypothetical protein [Ruminococcus sp.]
MKKTKSKKQKLTKHEIIISIFLILYVTVGMVASAVSHSLMNTMIGADGLKNINISIILKLITGIILAVPVLFSGIYGFIKIHNSISLFARIGIIFINIVVSAMFFLVGVDSHLDEQHYIRKEYGNKTDFNILFDNIYDLKNDNYETYTINNCYLNSQRYSAEGGRSGRNYYYNYTATFYNGKKQIVKAQIGRDDYDYLKNLPYGFDTEITVYKKSSFLRSVKPSVDFDRTTSYEHFLTISISGDQIVYEKNVDMKFKDIQWCGFKKNMNYDVKNSLFGIGISEERPSLDADYIGLLCEEVCIYGIVDGSFRRLSNILNENDLNKNSGT